MAGHQHDQPEADVVLRVKAIEQLLTEKGWSTRRRSTRWSISTRTASGRETARASSPAPGPMPTTRRG